mgnify:CR=1 FL=1
MFRTTTLVITLFAGPAFALCDGVDGFLTGDAAAAAVIFHPHPATCRVAREADGEALFCFSEHGFRSENATETAARLERTLIGCFGEGVTITLDDEVNHPDSYVAKTFAKDSGALSLSVKDKGALGKTLVFLRGAPR